MGNPNIKKPEPQRDPPTRTPAEKDPPSKEPAKEAPTSVEVKKQERIDASFSDSSLNEQDEAHEKSWEAERKTGGDIVHEVV